MSSKQATTTICFFIIQGFSQLSAVIWTHEDKQFHFSAFYHQEGDLHLLYHLSWHCSDPGIMLSRAAPFLMAIDNINKDSTLLQNVTLGFYMFNSCQDMKQTLLQTLSYTDHKYTESYCTNGDPAQPPWFDVAGVIMPLLSRDVFHLSHVAQISNIPLFTSAEATSDEFSDKNKHPTFFRTVSADNKQVNTPFSKLF